MNIPYTSLPGYSDLYIDYVNHFDKVAGFYEFPYDNEGIFNSITSKKEIYNNGNVSRIEIAELLKTQNKFFNSGESTFLNIEFLKEPDTFAVVTGQQIGVLTGNLYTIIKALNAVELSKHLSMKYPEFKFVPVFWLEADDHDFQEINNINVLDKENKPVNLSYLQKGQEKERYLTPTGRIVIDEYINTFTQNIKDTLIQTEFTEQLMYMIDRSYKEGIDLVTAFSRFFNYILGDTGLIFCNPTDKEMKKLLVPVFEKELNTFPETCELVVNASAELEQKYEPQVKPRSINLFYTYNDNRHLIEIKEEKFSLKNTRQKFEKDELFNLLLTNPENFSPNVILRPVCQDYLLPTAVYIGGPSEVAYFGQFRDVYNFYGMKMPAIYPRTSITILESRVENFLEKFGISFEELFDETLLSKKLLGKINEVNVDEIFSNFSDELNALIYTYGLELEKIDKNHTQGLKTRYDKFIENIGYLKPKFVESQLKQNDSTGKKLKTVIDGVYPDEVLQERFYNIIYFLNKYGFDFIKELSNTIELKKYFHQVISVSISKEIKQPALFDNPV
ncbi:MAG: bacillithiol biosynthesis cysteine-adding enzyme BshC [Ignavibacteria bacterium]|nr:bacillithiol biosynthesis cysteine-adding enzyme BshC [Ignavibacteria bacterium]